MPRYQNLKDTMNPYKNRQIGLSSSERTKNKKDKNFLMLVKIFVFCSYKGYFLS